MRTDVIDLSHHNTVNSGESVWNTGIIGVIHKATEGSDYVDPTLFNRAKRALELGFCWSTYHFLRPGSMEQQMKFYISTIDPKIGERVCLDHEDSGVSISDLESAVRWILQLRSDLQITIYSGHLIKEQLGDGKNQFLATETSLWIAQYSDKPDWPKGTWPNYSLWQWTDQGQVSGIQGNTDCDEFNGSAANCKKWFGPVGPEPEPVQPKVMVNIETSEDVEVEVYINGEEKI